ncbi:MAG TPA: UDP-N-acetylglucosamine--N-acetylmuramyl-(pentapeptide) pyrophosphoryl-undecaprenol N-acetylglucosamine transferase [Bryobacteraceae bacterium]|nr:UDP-N-acetylglucosamine--N-acetylmuramyl-(pentapeptide) pyrophosphoryl-undecaprenol N-acetylglucosamine transferase [Bryobacteraceae bacterium]
MSGAQKTRRVVVTGGGTAGHIFPALEFLEAYRQEYNADGCYIGCRSGLESKLVPGRGVRFEVIPGLPWARERWFGQFRAAASLPAGIRAARRILVREQAEVVIGTGGYASFGTCAAAQTLGIPVVIHEANAEPGLANRMIEHFASLVCVGRPEAASHFRRPVVVTGVPFGKIARSGPPQGPPWQFLVLGGSEGSPVLNQLAPLLFGELRRRGLPFTVRHVSGFADPAAIERAYATAGVSARVERFVDPIASLYAGAALAVTSAGARTLAELAAAGVPALLVPLEGAAHNHQAANARLYASHLGYGLVLEDPWQIATVAGNIEHLVSNPAEMRVFSRRAAAWCQPNAARDLVHACERYLFAHRFAPARNPFTVKAAS